MLALIIAMIICVALGAGVVGFVMIEARREGRGQFWTAEGEELIAGVRRTSEKVGEKVKDRSSQLGSAAAGRTQAMRGKRSVAAEHAVGRPTSPETDSHDPSDQPDGDLRAAS